MKKTEVTIKVYEVNNKRIVELYREGERMQFSEITDYEADVFSHILNLKVNG